MTVRGALQPAARGPGSALRLLLLDNYDSFTWNLAHAFAVLGAEVEVVLSDARSAEEVRASAFDAWVLSPGPGRPEERGIGLELARAEPEDPPLLGVCLGHQALAQAHGARLTRAPELVHGKTSEIEHTGGGLYRGLSRPFLATRYHSLVVDPASLPAVLEVEAQTKDGVIMGLRHRERPAFGVQFHPESVLTIEGRRLLANFLEIAAAWRSLARDAALARSPE